MASSNSQIDKRGRPKRAEPPDVNINTGTQSINTERGKNLNFRFATLQKRYLELNNTAGKLTFKA